MTGTTLIDYQGTYVAGRWVGGDETLAVENPADESLLCELPVTPLDEIRRAVGAARQAFDEGVWLRGSCA